MYCSIITLTHLCFCPNWHDIPEYKNLKPNIFPTREYLNMSDWPALVHVFGLGFSAFSHSCSESQSDYLQVWTKNARHYNHLCTYTDASCNIVSVTWDNVIFLVLFSCSIVSPTTLLLNQQLAEFKRVMAFLLLLALRSDYVSLWQSMAG